MLNIQYRLRVTNDSERLFELHLDEETLLLIPADAAEPPSWAALDY